MDDGVTDRDGVGARRWLRVSHRQYFSGSVVFRSGLVRSFGACRTSVHTDIWPYLARLRTTQAIASCIAAPAIATAKK